MKRHVQYSRLISAAKKAKTQAFAPFSNFKVGAAVLTASGKIITGCNIEVSSLSLTICAERTALFKARSEGHKVFRALAIATDQPEFISPCGACRQVIYELAGDIDLMLCRKDGKVKDLKLASLLPLPFFKSTFSS